MRPWDRGDREALFGGGYPAGPRYLTPSPPLPWARGPGGEGRMLTLRDQYIRTVEPVLDFLRGKRPELAHLICGRNWLPEGDHFKETTDLDHDFGQLGIHDRAKHLATLYLEDLGDYITRYIDPHFGFSRYAERLGRSAGSFDLLQQELEGPGTMITEMMYELLEEKILQFQPSLVALTVPFPGNLFGALACGKWIRQNHPDIRIVMGGGFVNTELRSLSDPRVFDYVDFITLDDGEAPLLCLVEHLEGQRPAAKLKRTFCRINGEVRFIDGSEMADIPQSMTGTPDYSGLPLDQYLSVIQLANPMHRLWSDGQWNKLMLAHGCYWAKCTFCDVTLDYIKRYEPNKAAVIVDRMEAVIAQTGHSGFHFTDEAAPPALLCELALEVLRRKLTVTWWSNIRFEPHFTADLCRLLRASGCIAVSGGLEVASERILKMINKGVTIAQVTKSAANFTRAGILVHAYLMYGFPTQTDQETVDSLEVVRQLFNHGLVQSGFWHRFAMTAHSPVGIDPARFGVGMEDTPPGTFANNDLVPIDLKGCDHELYGPGIEKSLYNYMHGICFDFPLQEWFDFPVPRTTVPRNLVKDIVSRDQAADPAPHSRVVWIQALPEFTFFQRTKKGKTVPSSRMTVHTLQEEISLVLPEKTGQWFREVLPKLLITSQEPITFSKVEELYHAAGLGSFKSFVTGPVFEPLRKSGVLLVV